MDTGKIEVIYGKGIGKTAFALGKGIQALAQQKDVIMIQFLKGCQGQKELDVLKRLEPGMKVFRFERSDRIFAELTREQKNEEQVNIRNGLNYARKVLVTRECDLLILDGVIGLICQKVIPEDDLIQLLEYKGEVDILLTGNVLPEKLGSLADRVTRLEQR